MVKCYDEKLHEVHLTKEEEQYYLGQAKSLTDNVKNVLVKYVDGDKTEIYNVDDKTWKDLFYEQKFSRIRRITGYLVGDTNTWNDYKKSELRDRVKHV